MDVDACVALVRAAVAAATEPAASAFEARVGVRWRENAPARPADDRRRATVELAIRTVLRSITEERLTVETFPPLERLLEMALYASSKGYLGDVVMLLIEDILEVQTIPSCELVFGFLESHMAALTQGMQPNKGRGLALLRLSNELLRRLSKTTHTAFGGRIRMFLANAFPLSERSGLNLAGSFNVDNETVVDPAPAADADDKDGYDFYARFWSIQAFFANPRNCLDPVGWVRLNSAADSVLTAFEKEEFDQQSAAPSAKQPSAKAAAVKPKPLSVDEVFFCPKYLTSRKLFKLQLRDATVQRQILVQLLVLADYLSTFTAAQRARVAAVPNKAATMPNMTLTETQARALDLLRDRALRQLLRLPPNGAGFAELVKRILERELPWVAWKLESCPPFEKDPADPAQFVAKKRRREDVGESGRLDLGSEALSALWNVAPNTDEFLRSRDRVAMVTIEEHLAKLETELLPENGIEADYRSSRNTIYVWRGVRLIARLMLDKFTGIPLVEANHEGRTVRVPNLEVFMDKLKAPAAIPSAAPTPTPPTSATPVPAASEAEALPETDAVAAPETVAAALPEPEAVTPSEPEPEPEAAALPEPEAVTPSEPEAVAALEPEAVAALETEAMAEDAPTPVPTPPIDPTTVHAEEMATDGAEPTDAAREDGEL